MALKTKQIRKPGECVIEGCNKPGTGFGMCAEPRAENSATIARGLPELKKLADIVRRSNSN